MEGCGCQADVGQPAGLLQSLCRGMSLNPDYQDSRMRRIRKFPENLKILEILVQTITLETSEKALGIATETEILVGSLRASAIQ